MDNKGFSDENKKNWGKSKSFSKYLTNAEFSFPLAKSLHCSVGMILNNQSIGSSMIVMHKDVIGLRV